MKLMRTDTIVVKPEPDGGYFVTVPALPGCLTRGSTIEERRERAVKVPGGRLFVFRERPGQAT